MLKLTLCVAGDDNEIRALHQSLRSTLSASLPPGSWHLDVVDVIQMPEKALQHDVFATPTLLRELPEPVIKVIGAIAQAPHMLALIQQGGQEGQTVVI